MAYADFARLLDEYSQSALIQMATFHGVLPKQQKNKPILIKLISDVIMDPESIRESLNHMSKTERAALDAILRRGGQASSRGVRVELTRLNLIDPAAPVQFGEYSYKDRPDARAANSRRLEDILARLMIRGLVFSGEENVSKNTYQTKLTFYDAVSKMYIPAAVLRYLPEPAPLPQAEEKLPELMTFQEGSARVFQRELYLYWSYVRDHPPALTQKDEIAKQALKDLNNLLLVRGEIQTGKSENDYPRLRFLRAMLMELGLVQENRTQAVEAVPTDFFTLAPAERVQRTFQGWLNTSRFNELLLLPEDVRPRGTAANPVIPAKAGLVKARKFIIDQLRRVKRKDWVVLQSLVNRINDSDYEFLLRRREFSGYYGYGVINPYEYTGNDFFLGFPGIRREEDGWDKVEANLIRGVVFGPLYWMGLVDLGWAGKEAGPPAAYRFTALGAWIFGLGPQPEIPVEGGRVIVQPTMQIVALDPIQDAVLVTLDRFAERLSAERAVEYRLTRASVYAAQQAGWDAERIKEVLEQYAGSPLPANVTRTLEEWQGLYDRIVIHPRVILMHGDPQAVDQVADDPAANGWVAARPLPEVALIKDAPAIPKIVNLLRSKEIIPALNVHAAVPPNAVTCAESGAVRLNGRMTNLYLHGHLAAFANPVEKDYQITPDSVQRAVRSGITAPEIIQRLEEVNSGPLPEKLVLRIRAWAKHYGNAAIAPLTLLQVRDQTVLTELLADPDIRPLIRPFHPQPPALAEVKPGNLEKLRALLAERGIDLEDHLK